MHLFGLVLFGIIAFFWLTHGIRVGYGAIRLPWLKKFSPAADPNCPRISLIFAARDEEEKLPAALATLMEIDYPNLEIIAVDDRSNDATRRILDDYAAAHPRLRVVHVTDLSSGWLGKPHAYRASRTRRRLAMEILDDMQLGQIVKRSGFRSGVGIAPDSVAVRWHAGLGNLIRGVTKNFFAGAGYNVGIVVLGLTGLFLIDVAPFLGLFLGHGWIRMFAAIAGSMALSFHAAVAYTMRGSPLYALTHPLGAILLSYMLLRSTFITLKQGGIVWRDTFYPLDELKRGVV